MTTAALFPGQGIQRVGIGQRFCHLSEAAARVFDTASEVAEIDVRALCWQGTDAELRKTQNAQLAVVVSSLAGFAMLNEWGFTPQVTAGHSVGEISALVAAGALTLEDAVKLVCIRGRLMGQLPQEGAMAAVLGLPPAEVLTIVRESASTNIAVALINSDRNTVLSGGRGSMRMVTERLERRGARVRGLNVSHAFHSDYMRPALSEWASSVRQAPVQAPTTPVLASSSGESLVTADAIKGELVGQLVEPVHWNLVLRALHQEGVRQAVEVGDSTILAGYSRETSPRVPTVTLRDARRARVELCGVAHA